ncbi:MAG TPA: MATE family efflux transporter [Caulobacteraceae bacterium]|nr:MATE family efflux transporter [Caulobacteraceae bacterium]
MTAARHSGLRLVRDAAAFRRVFSLAGPIILANLTQPLLSTVDAAIAGHMPAESALGGVALGGVVFNVVFWAFGFLRMGTTGLVAQAEGAREPAAMRTSLVQALLLAAMLGAALLALQAPLIAGALRLLGGSDSVRASAAAYAGARIWSAPATLANYAMLGYLLGRQRAGSALALQVLINLANVVLAVILVYGLGWSVGGLGAATAAADWVGLAAGLALVTRLQSRGLPPLTWTELLATAPLGRLVAVNRDIFLRTLCLMAAFAWFAHEGAALGDAVLAANAVLMNFMTVTAFALDGFAQAAEALVGDAVGRRDRIEFRRWVGVALLWSVAGAALFSLALAVCGAALVAALTDQPAIREAAMACLTWAAAAPLISVWCYLLDGVFIGATKTRELRNGAALSLVVFLGAAAMLRPPLGNQGLWAALMLFQVARAAVLAVWLGRIDRALRPAPATPSPESRPATICCAN